MWMPSITSYGFVHDSPIGQIAETRRPPPFSAFNSIHTRRSNGSGRFSDR
jgi:hypothetical protein